MTAINRKQPDRVPYCELGIDREIARQVCEWGEESREPADLETNPYTVEEAKELAGKLGLDNIYYVMRAPIYAHKDSGQHGRHFYGDGMIKNPDDVKRIELPDPNEPSFYNEARHFADNKGDYPAFFITRAGLFPAMLSMGLETFSIALFEDRSFLYAVMEKYFEWSIAVAEHACTLGFDVFVTTDDMAYKTGPLFSPQVFHEVAVPFYKELAKKVSLPWIMHSDGNILPLLDDWVDFGIAGIHPLENGTMDLTALKRDYGDRLCLLGNVDLNLLGEGTTDEVDAEVKKLIDILGPGGGYIVSSGNSLASYLKPDNIRAMSDAVRKYGGY